MSPTLLYPLSPADTDSDQDYLLTPVDMPFDPSYPYPVPGVGVDGSAVQIPWSGGANVASSPHDWFSENGSATALDQLHCGSRVGSQLAGGDTWAQAGYDTGNGRNDLSGMSQGSASRSGTASAGYCAGPNFGDQHALFDQSRSKSQSSHIYSGVTDAGGAFDVYSQATHTKMSRRSPTHVPYSNALHDENPSNTYVGPSSTHHSYPQPGLGGVGLGYRQLTNYDAHYVQSSSAFHHSSPSGLPPTQMFSHGSNHPHRRHTVSSTNPSPDCPYTYPQFNDTDTNVVHTPQPHSWPYSAGQSDGYYMSPDDYALSGVAPAARRSPPLVEDTPKRPLTLACLFCRKRKIACGSPPPGRTDKTCNQCARRNLKCVFPDASRRGMRPRLYDKEASTAPSSAAVSPTV